MISSPTLKTGAAGVSRWFLLLALAFSLSRTHGTYGLEFFVLVIVAALFFLTDLTKQLTGNDKVFLMGTLSFFVLRLMDHSSLEYVSSGSHKSAVYILAGLAAAFTLIYLVRPWRFFSFLAFFFLSVLLLKVPTFSPNPQVDVFTLTQKAIEHLFAGINPYTVEYQDKLSLPYGYRPGYSYPPGALLLSAFSQKILGDARTILAVALIASSGLLFFIGRKLGHTFYVSMLFALVWLAFPVNPLVIEQGWVDPLLIVSAVTLAYGLHTKKSLWTVLSLGIHLSIKQYAPLTLAITALWLWRTQGIKSAAKTSLLSLALFLLIIGPFVLSAPQSFLQMAYYDVFGQAPRTESFTFFAFFYDVLRIYMPDWVTVLILTTTFLSFAAKWKKTTPSLADWSLALFLLTFLGFLFARRAFCNYFHFSAIFLVLYLLFSYRGTLESYR